MSYTRVKKLLSGELFRSSMFMTFSSIVGALSRFLLVTILARFLTSESYGIWVSITSVAAIMMYGDMGITNALRNKLSMLVAEGESTSDLQRQYFYTAFYFFLIFSFIIAICFLVLVDYLPIDKLYNTNDMALKAQGVSIFIFIQIVFIIGIPFGMVAGLFFSYGESRFNAITNIITSVLTLTVTMILAFVFQASILILAKFYFGLNFAIQIFVLLFFIYKRKWYNDFSIEISSSGHRIKKLLSSGITFLGVQLSTSYIQNIPTIMLGAVQDLTIAASFNIVQKLYTLIVTIYQSAFNPIWSRLTILAQLNNWQKVKMIRNKVIILTIFVLSVPTLFFTFFSEPIIQLVAGDGYIVSKNITVLLGISFIFFMLFEAASLLQNALGKLRLRLVLQIIFFVAVNYLMGKALQNYGIATVPIILSLIWASLFFAIYYQGNYLIKNQLK